MGKGSAPIMMILLKGEQAGSVIEPREAEDKVHCPRGIGKD